MRSESEMRAGKPYRISKVTGKRLPSKNVIYRRIKELEDKLNTYRSLLLEHLEPRSKA